MWKACALAMTLACSAAERPVDADPKPGSCDAVAKAMGTATRLASWKPPATCQPTGGDHAPRALASEADARPHVACKDPDTTLGIDFAKRQLIVTSRSYSPAQVGLDVYDDGTQITFVSRQRSPCKNDPRPMPSPNQTFLFEAAGGARTFAESSCTVATTCP